MDGGNTKTEAVLLSQTGEVLGHSRFGTGDIYNPLGEAAAVSEVLAAVHAALDAANVTDTMVSGASFCLAGVDWPEDADFWRSAIAHALPGLRNMRVTNDAYSGIYSANVEGRGIAIVAGTAGAVAARGPTDSEWVMSFWAQEELGAVGLSKAAYRAIVLAELGVAEPTALRDVFLSRLECDTVGEMVHRFTRRHGRATVWSLARLAPYVTSTAGTDRVANDIVAAQAASLCRYAQVAGTRVGFCPEVSFVISLSGGVLRDVSSPVVSILKEQLLLLWPRAIVTTEAVPAAAGAAVMAMAMGDARPSPTLLERISQTLGNHVPSLKP